MEHISVEEKARNIGIAVANWLCGTLEGIGCDNADIALADALDAWLRWQKKKGEALYAGSVVCESCGRSWECLVLIADTGSTTQCPHCGAIQKISPIQKKLNHIKPENAESLGKIQNETQNVISRISDLQQVIKDFNKQIGATS